MRYVFAALAVLSLAACGSPSEQQAATINVADFTIVHTCKNGREIYRANADQGLMIWKGETETGYWIELDGNATIEGVCGEVDASTVNITTMVEPITDQYSTTP